MTVLRERVKEMMERLPDSNREYYALTLLADDKGTATWSCFSHWAGWADVKRRIELRAGSLVRAGNMAKVWRELGMDCAVVNDVEEMHIFFLLGGNVLVERTVAETVVPEVLAPQPVVNIGAFGFQHVDSLPKSAFNRVPTPNQRMRVLKRDDYRCRICGRRPTDHVDIELHVHHVRPWVSGGVSHEGNLITLCHTCHNGLDPHYEWGLYDLIAPSGKAIDTDQPRKEYWEGVRCYRDQLLKNSPSLELLREGKKNDT